MKKRGFIFNAIILTAITLSLRLIGTIFSVYLANKIGAEGIGLYQLMFSVFMLGVTIATSGISIAVTRIVAEAMAQHNCLLAKATVKRGIIFSIILSLIGTAFIFFNAHYIATEIINDSRVIKSLQLLSIGLPFLSVASCLRGYFLGLKQAVLSVSGEIIELMVMISVSVPLVAFFLPNGLEWACLGLVIASLASEIISCCYAFFLYLRHKLELKGSVNININRKLFNIAYPMAISSYVRSILATLENILIPKGLKKYGLTDTESLSQYGMIKGMVLPIIYFPQALLQAFASLLIPEVASATINNRKRVDYIIERSLQATLVFSMLIMALFIRFYDIIGQLLYNDANTSKLLFILAPLVPLIYLDTIVDAILKGLNEQLSSMGFNTAESLLRVMIIFFVVPILGFKGYILMLFFGTVFNALLSLNRLLIVSKMKFKWFRWLLLPLILAVVSVVISTNCTDIIGLIILLSSYAIMNLLFRRQLWSYTS